MSTIDWSSDPDLSRVAERPGVYLFRDRERAVLYVGKAANLRSRLRSYRRPGGDGRFLIQFMERDASSVETIVTRTEQEALLLEDSLIKTHKPRHNIRLKDDKSFLMLELDLEGPFPRFEFARAHRMRERAGAEAKKKRLFGPFASSSAVRRTLSDLHRVVPMRDCPDSVMNHRSRPCLKHQIGLCAAPCVGLIGALDYRELVERAEKILGGDTDELEIELESRMRAASEALDYERAAQWRDRLAALRRTVEGQGVRPKDEVRRDVLGLARRGADAVIHRLAFRERRLAESRSHRFRSELPDAELWHVAVTALYSGWRAKGVDEPAEIVLGAEPSEREALMVIFQGPTKLVVPKSGERLRMLDLARENAEVELARQGREASTEELALGELAVVCRLEQPPSVIDCFDISNIQGAHQVASRVRFRAGHADRDGYRRFKIRGVEGQDDFASMREVVLRSLKRGVAEDDVPDLVVIDGGKAQLDSALEAREEAGAWDVEIVALAKARSERKRGEKRLEKSEERLFLAGEAEPIVLGEHAAAKHLLERVRDEAHRFAITYHRKERGRITSELDSIPGVGAVKRKALLRTFGSVQGVRAANVEALAALVGRELALVIHAQLRR